MNHCPLPRALFVALVAVAAPAPAVAALPPVRVELVNDATLDAIHGKYLGSDMLVGLRIDIVSRLQSPGGGQAEAMGTLWVQRTGSGFDVHTNAQTNTSAGSGGIGTGGASAIGGDGVSIAGIGQVNQIAGANNQFGNLAWIGFMPVQSGGAFNGATASHSNAGGYVADITFLDGGVQVGLQGPAGFVGQTVGGLPGVGGQALQVARIAGDGQIGGNLLHLQILTTAMPALLQQQEGVYQALAALQQMPR